MTKTVGGVVLRPNQFAFAVASAFLSAGVAAQTAPGTLPTGGQVTSGGATLTYTPNKLQVDQGTNKAILQWDNFSIGSSAWVNFSQPSASSVALNRVTGTNPSEIFGRLTANGQVFLSNPSGVLFAPGASVDVGGLFATTLSIADRDFLAGRYNFYNAGGAASVVNQGVITATGYAALAGPQVKNDGIIVAHAGTVALAAGDRVSLDMVGDGLIKVSVDEAALNASAINSGRIEADGGNVILTAHSANALLDTVVNNTGIIRANSLVERNGEIVLDGGSAGVVANSGTLQAAGVDAGTTGGVIRIVGDRVGVAGVVDASGDAVGGSIIIGSQSGTATFIAAEATIRADATREGSGGFVETSGHYLEVNSAPQVGPGGTWLIDPYNIEIVDGTATSSNNGAPTFTPSGDNSQIGATLISNQLNAGGNVTIDTGSAGSPGGQAGDLLVNAEISKTSLNGSTLTLSAFHDLQINRNISMATGQLSFNAGSVTNKAVVTNNTAISTGLGSNTIFSGDTFNLAGGTINAGRGAVILRPRTGTNSFGIESAGATTLTNADIASITTSDFVVFGSGTTSLFSGNMTIGANTQVNGDGKNLAFFRGGVPGSTTVGAGGVSTSGNVIVSAGGGALSSAGGVVAGNQVQLRASTGIGAAAARVNTAANVLAVNNSSGAGAFVNAIGPVTVNNVSLTVGGIVNNIANVVSGGGAYDLVAAGVTVAAPVNAGTINVNAAGDLQIVAAPGRLASLASTAGQTLTATSVQLLSNGGSAAITNTTGNTVLNADAFSLAGGAVNGGTGAVVLRPRTGTNSLGIEAAGDTTLTNADIASISTSDFVVFGSGIGTIFTGNMAIGANAQVAGGGKNLAFFRSGSVFGGSTTVGPFGVATSGNVIISGGGGALNSNGGAVAGNQVQLRANTSIGSATSRLNTSAHTLAITSGTAFVNATGPVSLDIVDLTVGGNVNNFSNTVAGAYDLTAANAVTVAGSVTGGSVSITAGGPLKVQGSLTSTFGETLTASSLELDAGATLNNSTGNTVVNADAFSLAGGAINGGSGAVVLRPRNGTNSFGIESAGQTTLRNADIAAITTSDFIVFGSGIGTTFTGDMTIGANARVNGGDKNLAFFRSSSLLGGSTTVGTSGVSTTGNLIVSAGGGALNSNGGLVAGNQVQLRATTGIGSATSRVNTAANVLAINDFGGSAFVNATAPLTLSNVNLNVGGMGNNFSNNVTGTYDLTAAGSVTVAGQVSGGTMNVDVAGPLKVLSTGSAAASLAASAGQTIKASSLELTAEGINASIVNITGNQTIDVAGDITLQNSTTNFTNSFAGIAAPVQAITAGGDIKLQANFATGTGHGVRIGGLSGTAPTSTNLDLSAGGNVTLAGGTGTDNGVGLGSSITNSLSNNITINAGGNVMLTSGVDGGARIGYAKNQTGAGDISIKAASIQLNGTTQPTAIRTTGNVSLDANGLVTEASNGFIAANKLTVKAGSASLTGANTIGVITAPLQSGANGIAGNFTLVNSGPLTISDLTAGGRASIANTGATTVSGLLSSGQAMDITVNGGGLSVAGAPDTATLVRSFGGQTVNADSIALLPNGGAATITNNGGGNTLLSADTFRLAGGAVNGGSGAVILRPRTGTNSFGVEAAGQTTVSNADIAAITTSDFVVFGSGLGTTFTGNMTIGANAQVDGGGKNLAFFRSSFFGGSTTVGGFGVATTGNLILSGGGGALNSNGGVVDGNQVQLRANIGIGGADSRLNTAAKVLAVNVGGVGGAFVNATGPVTLNNVNLTVGGITNNFSNNVVGAYDLTAANTVTVEGPVIGTTMNLDIAGALKVVSTGDTAATLSAGLGQTIKAGSLDLNAENGVSALIRNFNGNQTINVAGDITLENSSTNITNSFAGINGPLQTISAGGDVKLQANFATGTSHGVRIGGLAGPAPTSTTLDLVAGGNVMLSGGSGANNGAAIGSSIVTSLPNNITIHAGGNVALASGSDGGARIGYAANQTGAGDISITAANVLLDGTAQPTSIRTTGNVTLNASGVVSQDVNGFIVADALNLRAASASLTGPNELGALNATVGSDVTLVNSGALNVTWLSATGNATVNNTGDVTMSGAWSSGGTASITASGSIGEQGAGAISAVALATSSGSSTTLGGANQVPTFSAASGSDVLLTNASPVLSLGSMTLPGALTVNQTGALSLKTIISSLSQSYSATGDIAVGDAGAAASTVLSASDAMTMSSGGRILLRGSDTSTGASAIVSGGAVNMSSAGDLLLTGGAAAGSQALIYGGNTIDLHVGGVLALDGTSDNGAWARVQTATTSGQINVYFPTASSGGYFVDGFQRLKHGEDGFFTGDKPAKSGSTLFLHYGN